MIAFKIDTKSDMAFEKKQGKNEKDVVEVKKQGENEKDVVEVKKQGSDMLGIEEKTEVEVKVQEKGKPENRIEEENNDEDEEEEIEINKNQVEYVLEILKILRDESSACECGDPIVCVAPPFLNV